MKYRIDAACHSSKGRIRHNNEDNLLFCDQILPVVNDGLSAAIQHSFSADDDTLFAVFDGMGGEDNGEQAAYTAAFSLKEQYINARDSIIVPECFLADACYRMNDAVCRISEDLKNGRMGSTVVSLYTSQKEIFICNVGDSRAYGCRKGHLLQLSQDHVESMAPSSISKQKPRLTQHLGIFSDEMLIEPYVAKGELQDGDIYLLCSDGLTDMLTDDQIRMILQENSDVRCCADSLVDKALKNGGKDNITVIVIAVHSSI